MKPGEQGIIENLMAFADATDDNWTDRERVDWQDAEDLVAWCTALPKHLLQELPAIKKIVEYPEHHEDWDSGEVELWPRKIKNEARELLLRHMDTALVIRGDVAGVGEHLYWSRTDGWVNLGSATQFLPEEARHLNKILGVSCTEVPIETLLRAQRALDQESPSPI